jgi:hypothetical protein
MSHRFFYLYDRTSKIDRRLCQELEGWMYTLYREETHTRIWHENLAGDDVDEERRRLRKADVILILMSVDLLRSDPLYQQIFEALEQRARGALVFPVLLRPTGDWSLLPLRDMQPLPRSGRPVSLWKHRDKAWKHVSEEIRAQLEAGTLRCARPDDESAAPATRSTPSHPRDDITLVGPAEEAVPTRLSALSPPGINKLAGEYHLVRHIGRGGMSLVVEGVHASSGKRAAIKIFSSPIGQESDARLASWEARATTLAAHPNVVEIYASGTLENGQSYLALELLEGRSLSEEQHDRVDLSGTIRIAQEVAVAMAVVHERGVIHCDLKPSNIMLCSDPLSPTQRRAKIFDFGIAKIGERAPDDPFGGNPTGTLLYMSPEQLRERNAVTSKSDVYTLGVTLFQLLSGRLPFFNRSGIRDLFQQHLEESPPSIASIEPRVPARVADLVHRMLAKAPEERPSMAEVALHLSESA